MSVTKKQSCATQFEQNLVAKIYKQYKVVSIQANDVRLVTIIRVFNEKTGANIFNCECNSLFNALSVLKNSYPTITLNNVDYVDFMSGDLEPDNTVVFPAMTFLSYYKEPVLLTESSPISHKLSIASTCWDRGIRNLIEFEQEGGHLLANDCCVHPNEIKYVGADNAYFKSGKDLLKQNGKPDHVFKSSFGTMFVYWNDFSEGGDALFVLFEEPKKDVVSYAFVSGAKS